MAQPHATEQELMALVVPGLESFMAPLPLQQGSSELTTTSASQGSPVRNKALHHSHWFQI